MSQLGVYKVRITHKDKEETCQICVVSGGGPALQGIPDVRILELLSVKCNTMKPSPKTGK